MDRRAAAPILAKAEPLPKARYVVFYCADPMDDDDRQTRPIITRASISSKRSIRRRFSPIG